MVPTLHSEVQGAALSVLPHVFDSNALHVHVLNIKYKPSPTAAKGTLSRRSGPCAARGCRLFTGTLSPAKSMRPLARVILFKYVAIALNQCLTETAGNSPGHLRGGGKVRTWWFNKQGRLVPFCRHCPRSSKSAVCSRKTSEHYFPLGSVTKSNGTSQLSPQSFSYLQIQVSVKTGRAAQRRCPQGKLRWRAAPQKSPRRRAKGGIQTATRFWRHKTCLYNDILQQAVSFGTLVLLKLCPFQALSLEHQEGAWKNRVPFASVTTGNAGRGARRWPQLYLCPWYKCLASSGPQALHISLVNHLATFKELSGRCLLLCNPRKTELGRISFSLETLSFLHFVLVTRETEVQNAFFQNANFQNLYLELTITLFNISKKNKILCFKILPLYMPFCNTKASFLKWCF